MQNGLFARVRAVNIWLMAPLLGLAVFMAVFAAVRPAQAATSSNLNFQARLLTSSGAVVPDGSYNIDFKIYNADSTTGTVGTCTGACLWEETRTNAGGHGVTVINGYFSVNLGSVTSLPSTINWDQPLWLTMNLTTNGTMAGAPTSGDWDGEMQNGGHSISLTALPYSFVAGKLAKTDGSGNRGVLAFNTVANNPAITLPDATGTVCLQTSSSCGFESTTGTDFIQNSTGGPQTANFNIQSAAAGSIGAIIQGASGQTADLFQVKNSSTVFSVGNNGQTLFKPTSGNDSATFFQVQNASNSKAVFTVDTTNGKIIAGAPGASGVTGTLVFDYSGQTGSITLDASSPASTAYSIHLPAENGTVCLQNSANCGFLTTTGSSFLAKNATDTSQADAGSTQLYSFKNSGSAGTGGVLKLDNNTNTGSTLAATTAGNPASGKAVLYAEDTNASPSGNLLDLRSGSTPTSKFSVDASGNVLASGTYNTNTFTSSTLQFGAASSASLQSASSQALNITGNASSTWSVGGTNQNLTINTSGTGTLAIDTTGAGTVNLGNTNATTIGIGGASGAVTTIGGGNVSHTIHIGDGSTGTNTITIGTTNSSSATTIAAGTGNINLTPSGSSNSGVIIKPGSNSSALFQIQNASGANLINVDSTATANLITNGGFESGTTGWTLKNGSTLTQSTSHQWQGSASLSVAASTTANSGASYNYTFTASTQYTLSLWAKVGSSTITDFVVGRQDVSGTDVTCLTAQTLTTAWQRFSCTFTTGGTITSSNIFVQKSGSSSETIFIDGVQLEQAASATQFNPGGSLQFTGTVNSPLTIQNKEDSTAALKVANASGRGVLTVDTANGQAILGAGGSGGVNGTLLFYNSTGSHYVGLSLQGDPSNDYTLQLPVSPPGSNLCIKTGNSNPDQLVYGNCVAPSTPVFVQQVINGQASGTSLSTTVANTSSTDLIVVLVSVNIGSADVSSVTDGAGNTYSKATAGGTTDSEIWYSANTQPTTSVTVHLTTSAAMAVNVVEYGGITTSSPFESGSSQSNATSGTQNSPSITTTTNNDLVIAQVAYNSNATASGNGTGWNDLTLSSNGQQKLYARYQTLAIAGSDSTSWGTTNSTASGSSIAAFKPAAAGADYAEYYGTVDPSITAGDLVALDPSKPAVNYTDSNGAQQSKAWVVKASSSNQTNLLGVVSTNPGQAIGNVFPGSDNPRPVALSGRVPVRVNTQNGPVEPGDYLVPSGTPGVAMKATQSGWTIGEAMSAYSGSGTGTVIVFANRTWYDAGLSNSGETVNGIMTVNGNILLQATADSSQVFRIQDSGGNNVMTVDTQDLRVLLGSSGGSPVELVLGAKTGAEDPAGVNGAMYYNAAANKFRCYENGTWTDCLSGPAASVTTYDGSWSAGSGAKSTKDSILIVPIYIPGQMTVNEMRVNVANALGAAGDIGLYDDSGKLVIDGGSGSLSPGTGLKNISPSQTGKNRIIEAGQYYAAITWDSTTGQLGGITNLQGQVKHVGSLSGGGLALPASIDIGSVAAGTAVPGISFDN